MKCFFFKYINKNIKYKEILNYCTKKTFKYIVKLENKLI